MARTIGLIGAGLVVALAALIGVMAWRTAQWSGEAAAAPQLEAPQAPAFDVDKAAAALGGAVKIQTVTYENGDPKPGADQAWIDLRAYLAQTYPAVFQAAPPELIAGHTMLFTWAGSDLSLPPVILMAHQDTVPVNPGTEGDWTHGPFGGVVADGYVWGRGAMDDKGSLIALMESANALIASGFKPKRSVMFLFGHDEEVAGKGAETAFAELKARGVKPYLVLDEGFFVMDPNPLTGKRTALVGVAEKGSVSIRITAETEGGHSSRPPLNSGAVRIARAILALEDNQMPTDLEAPPFDDMMKSLAPDLPYITRFALANQWLLGGVVKDQLSEGVAAAMVRTTTAPTMMEGSIKENVLPQRANATVNFRVHPNDSVEKTLQHVKDVTKDIEGLKVEIAGGIGSGPSPVSAAKGSAWDALKTVARIAANGGAVAPALVIAATDARYASAISDDAVYRFQPAVFGDADLAGFHGTNERLSVENLGRMIRGYAQLILLTCS